LEDPTLPEIPRKRSVIASDKFVTPKPKGAFEHDRAFKPGGTKMAKTLQLQDFIGKFPEYICSKPDELTRKPEVDTDQRGWCVTYKGLGTPSPSVATNYRNLKASFPGTFKR